MARHVFVDNSNIHGGAQKAAAVLEAQAAALPDPNVIWPAVRVYYPNLLRLIEGKEDISTRVIAGSVPPGNEALWEYTHKLGYNTDLLNKVSTDDGYLVE